VYRFLPGPQALAEAEQQMLEVSARWLRSGKGPELGFSLGRLRTLQDPAITVGLAYDAKGLLEAFVSWLPAPARKAWTLDLMRRRPDGVARVMEALIVKSIEEAARRGLTEVSLGLAPLALAPSRSGALGDRALRDVYARLDRFRRSYSLRQFKSKFDPAWEERYLAVPTTVALPEVLFALLRAHLPPSSALMVRLRALWPPGGGRGRTGWVGTG
jgi:lysylphosphatidylglycerol synthetase-like protein (DUF2156 family)